MRPEKRPMPTDIEIRRKMRAHEKAAHAILASTAPMLMNDDERYSRAAGFIAASAKLSGETSGEITRRMKVRQYDTIKLRRLVSPAQRRLAAINRKRNPGCVRGRECTCTVSQHPKCGNWRLTDPAIHDIGGRDGLQAAIAAQGVMGFERTQECVSTAMLAKITGDSPGALATGGAIQVCAGEWRADKGGWRFWRDPLWDEDAPGAGDIRWAIPRPQAPVEGDAS